MLNKSFLKTKLFLFFIAFALVFSTVASSVQIVESDVLGVQLNASTTAEVQAKKIYNTVFTIRGNGEEEFASTNYLDKLNRMYNTSKFGMRSYFTAESLGSLDVETKFPLANSSIELTKEKKYYMPRYEYNASMFRYDEINELGYDNRSYVAGSVVAPETSGALVHAEHFLREQQLIREVATAIENKNLSLSSLDGDGDGIVDSATILFDSEYSRSSVWNSILWPHMSSVYNISLNEIRKLYFCDDDTYSEYSAVFNSDALLNQKKIEKYNFITTGYIENDVPSASTYGNIGNVGVLCHEFLHNLGLYDYYSYINSSYQSVGELDIMGSTMSVPQMNLSYLRQKLGWLKEGENIIPAEKSGRYTLSATSLDSTVKAIKIVPNDYAQTKEYFMVEMRSNACGDFDSMLTDSGLVVYRVNETNGYLNSEGKIGNSPYGNMYSDYVEAESKSLQMDEVYVFRCGAGKNLVDNNDALALFNGSTSRNGYVYRKDIIGTTDESVQTKSFEIAASGLSGILGAKDRACTIFYSNGKNSCIGISNIKLSSDEKSVTFDLRFDDQSSSITNDSIEGEISSFYGGRRQLVWKTPSRSGSVTMMAVELDSKLVTVNDNLAEAKYVPTVEEMNAGKIKGYSTISYSKTPISFLKTDIEKSSRNIIIYAMFDDGETQIVKFCGVIRNNGDEIASSPLIFKYIKLISVCLIALCVITVVLVCVIIIYKVNKKKSN